MRRGARRALRVAGGTGLLRPLLKTVPPPGRVNKGHAAAEAPQHAAMSSVGLEAAPAEAAPHPVPREGLSLAALRAFADQHATGEYTVLPAGDGVPPAKLPFKQLTTAQVVEAIVKPATEHGAAGGAACTYAELLIAQVRGLSDKSVGKQR